MTVDSGQMRYLIAPAEALSFTRGVERCNVSRPPPGRAMLQLEEELGVRLFQPDAHGIVVNLAGQSRVNDARRALPVNMHSILTRMWNAKARGFKGLRRRSAADAHTR